MYPFPSFSFHITGQSVAPNWRNQITLESLEKFLEYNPAANIHLISPTPLLMLVASHDILTPTDLAVAAYQRAREPKSLVIMLLSMGLTTRDCRYAGSYPI